MNKRGQITLFVIIAILIIGAVALVLTLKPTIIQPVAEKIDIQNYMEDCIGKEAKTTVDKLSIQGGYINATFFRLYDGNKASYLCYTEEPYKACINQQPMLKKFIETEIKSFSEKTALDCMNTLKPLICSIGCRPSIGRW